jgi:ferredoxin
MPKLIVDGQPYEVPAGKRLVNALTDIANVDQLHACGGQARCTTCRVQFIGGEPAEMTEAEKSVLGTRGLLNEAGLRLSCQLLVDREMEVKTISRLAGSGRPDAGKPPAEQIEPPPMWTTK